MKKTIMSLALAAGLLVPVAAGAQVKPDAGDDAVKASADTAAVSLLSLDDVLRIALSENVSVKVADKEIQRAKYAQRGSYAALFPSIDGSASYQRTIKKQVMYMDFDMSSMMGGGAGAGVDIPGMGGSEDQETPQTKASGSGSGSKSGGGIEVGRWNTYSAGVSAAMPLVNAQLWKSLAISAQDVELAVEKARASRLDMVSQVKQSYFAVLLAKEAFEVYRGVYENALANFQQTERRYKVEKASELEYTRAKATVENAIPNVYNAESSVILALWQLKAVMGIDLDENIDVSGSLEDYAQSMYFDIHENEDVSLDRNSTMKQLAIQAEELANTVKLQKYASLPSLNLAFSYSLNAMTNDFKFSEYKWSPYSFVGLSLSVPIFAGGKRYHAVKQAQVQLGEFELQKANTERQLKIAIRQYLSQMETAMKNRTAAEGAVKTADKAYSIAEKSYNVGRSTITELNDAQLALTQAKLGVSQAIYNFVVAKTSLEQVIGADFID